jgi:hypothetical protein
MKNQNGTFKFDVMGAQDEYIGFIECLQTLVNGLIRVNNEDLLPLNCDNYNAMFYTHNYVVPTSF